MTLKELCAKYSKTVNGMTWPDKDSIHSYIDVYEELLAPYRNTAKNILEIGILSGASLRMWEQYFTGNVYGIDCDEKPIGGQYDLRPMIAEGTHNISIGDATNADDIKKFYEGIRFDVIIDDGSHQLVHQLKSYSILKEYLADGGIYIIEDIADIDNYYHAFKVIDFDKKIEVIDLRKNKGRFDDVLVVVK